METQYIVSRQSMVKDEEIRPQLPKKEMTKKTSEKKKGDYFKKATPSLSSLEDLSIPSEPRVELGKFADKTLASGSTKESDGKKDSGMTYTSKVKDVREAYHFVKEVYEDIDAILLKETGHGVSDHGADLIDWTVKAHGKLTDKGADLIEGAVGVHDRITDKGADLIEGAVDVLGSLEIGGEKKFTRKKLGEK